jgi:hypothetical protein
VSVYSYPDAGFLPEVTRPLERVTERISVRTLEPVFGDVYPGDDVVDLSYYVDRSFGNRIVGGWSARRVNGSGGTNGVGGTGAGVAFGSLVRPAGTQGPTVRERGVLQVVAAGNGFSGLALNQFGDPSTQIPGRLWLGFDVAPADWTPAGGQFIGGMWQPLFSQQSYGLQLNPAGTLSGVMSSTGGNTVTLTSTANLAGRANGERLLVGVDLRPDNGAGGRSATFYTAPPPPGGGAAQTLEYLTGVTWSQLGAVVTGSPNISLFPANARLEFGSLASLSGVPLLGRLFAAELRSGGGPPPAGTRVQGVVTTREYVGRTVTGMITGFNGRDWIILPDGPSFVAPP